MGNTEVLYILQSKKGETMHIRRLVKSGAASHTISLPKTWLDKNRLDKGNIIYIKEKSDKELVITPEARQDEAIKKDITINIDKKDLDTIQREITSAYVNNYNTITILGKDLDVKTKDIRKLLHDFVALEISELTSSKIVAKDLLNMQEISVEKTIRRMDNIIRSMVQDAIESVDGKDMAQSVFQRDFDVNKLYFLMFRILKSALNDSRVAESFQITNADALSSWHLALNLENIADNSKSICENLQTLDKKADRKELKELYKEMEKSYLEVMKAHYTRDKKLADSVAKRRAPLIERCNLYFEKHHKLDTFKVISGLKEFQNMITAVSRIVIDAEEVKQAV
jgi:phosphate uptake regulator